MNEAPTTIPPGLVGKIVEKPPAPGTNLDFRIWKIPPPCKQRKKYQYISGRLFFFTYGEIRRKSGPPM